MWSIAKNSINCLFSNKGYIRNKSSKNHINQAFELKFSDKPSRKLARYLYENSTIYVIEYNGQNVDSNSDYIDDVYTYPTGDGNIVFQWDLANTFVDEFFMFNFDVDY